MSATLLAPPTVDDLPPLVAALNHARAMRRAAPTATPFRRWSAEVHRLESLVDADPLLSIYV